ncbi:hypothetical protein [Methanopyrus sp. SNP6]|uniref:hypothetical protein n=1 Tax=Methanopyrus sp. SNP6 TaxID=1937005 RepID=UPI0014393C54|nr:hypothetical protein [Methanopyrus sp. SNP6]
MVREEGVSKSIRYSSNFHLIGATEVEVKKMADRLEELGVSTGPCHCSGEVAKRVFRRRFEFLNVGPGLVIRV